MRPTYAVINLSNLKKNYLNIRKKTKNVKIMAVVKADAYGHGMKETVKTLNSLKKNKPEYYAVATAEEGAELRSYRVKQPILIFEPFVVSQLPLLFKYDLIATVFSDFHLKILLKGKKDFLKLNYKIKVHVKVDTGMNRLGIHYDEAFTFIQYLSKKKDFLIDGIYTHFATSDERDKKFANLQLERFKKIINQLRNKKIPFGLAHAANSGAILDMPEAYLDMVRPGISLYGYCPSLQTSESIQLKPVMSVISHVASVKEINPGDSVSYGRKFTAEKKMKVVSVPIGYADGYNRLLTNKGKAIIRDKVYNQIGTVTMDRILFKVNNDKIEIGDKVILLGDSKHNKITAWDWANKLGTIPYEITCGISKRVPRIYKNNM